MHKYIVNQQEGRQHEAQMGWTEIGREKEKKNTSFFYGCREKKRQPGIYALFFSCVHVLLFADMSSRNCSTTEQEKKKRKTQKQSLKQECNAAFFLLYWFCNNLSALACGEGEEAPHRRTDCKQSLATKKATHTTCPSTSKQTR